MIMSKKLLLIDASSLSSAGCLRKWYLAHALGYRTTDANSVQIEYGSAFHVFREILKKYNDSSLAIAAAQLYFKTTPMSYPSKKEWMTVGHLTQTCITYLEQSAPQGDFISLTDENGIPLVEQTVSIPYYQDEFCEMLLSGTMDDIGKIKNGCYLVPDIKTTGAWNHREYFQSYELSHQLMFYNFMLLWLGQNRPNTIWETMSKGRIGFAVDVAFLSPTKATEFERSKIQFYSADQMEEFKAMLDSFIARLLPFLDGGGTLPRREGILTQTCHGRFDNGRCQFCPACSAPDERATELILMNNFKMETYNPLKFRQLPVAVEELITKWKGAK